MIRQELSDKPLLMVYKASAGSGKTHQLTGEILRLLFLSPYAYRHILSVTFTNKATDEMKSRVIKELARLSLGERSDYLDKLYTPVYNTEEKVRDGAKTILNHILHDYSAFSVNTIDRFFQQTMRSFTRELGLKGGYNVELDTDKVLLEAIDSMLYNLEKTGNRQLLEWLIRFSEEKIESGETWNIRNDICSLSSEIFKESYKAFSDDVQMDIANKQLLDDYKSLLLFYIRNFEKQLQQIGEKGLNIMDRFHLKTDDFKGTSRSSFGVFRKWANGERKEPSETFIKLANNVSSWYSAKTAIPIKVKIEDAYNAGLNDCINEVIALFANTRNYYTAVEINRYFFALGILGDVDKNIREYAFENNIMLISDTTELLHKIVKDTDAPFIYEKTGTYIDHYMIDEFQDTSNMQWANFYPLLKDSIAGGKENLIVGDVKQSIYRWRNSDWNLLNQKIDEDFDDESINHRTLDTNWRSLSNVIQFNNAVFSKGSVLLQALFNSSLPAYIERENVSSLQNKILSAYRDARQKMPEKRKNNEGYVSVDFIDRDEHPDWQTRSLEKLPETIEKLQDKGYRLKDIAILVRTKKEGANIANMLLEYKEANPDSKYRYDIISDEALFLNASKSIKLIISLFRYIQNPLDVSLKTMAVYEYNKYYNKLDSEDALNLYFSVNREFPEELAKKLGYIKELSLYRMAEEMVEMFREAIDGDENIYIQSFLDLILDYTVKNVSDLDSFLSWWDDFGMKKTIFTPDEQDAIRIMTIHKSKGLGFDVVILPFCNWELDHKLTTILWCNPETEPFNKLSLVPVKYSHRLKDTIFEKEYYNERLNAFVDNLNILYVSFTRAKKELIVTSVKPKENEEISSISGLLWHCITQAGIDKGQDINLKDFFDQNEKILEIGKDFVPDQKKEDTSNLSETAINSFSSISFDGKLKLRLRNKYYFGNLGQRDYGTMMHDILSRIETFADLDSVMHLYCINGTITTEEKNKISDELNSYLSNENVAEWYSGKYRILNEVQILQPNAMFVRPDRVMIDEKENKVIVVDYKFGEKENKKYIRQVKSYADRIIKMGYRSIEAYIWYVKLNKIIEIPIQM